MTINFLSLSYFSVISMNTNVELCMVDVEERLRLLYVVQAINIASRSADAVLIH